MAATTDSFPDIPGSKINIGKALSLRLKHNYSYQQLADTFKCAKQSVHAALAPILKLIDNPELANAYKSNRGAILNNLELTLVCDLADEEKRKNASLNNTAYALGQVNKMRLLEEGHATENIQFADISDALNEAKRRRLEKLNELAELENKQSGNDLGIEDNCS